MYVHDYINKFYKGVIKFIINSVPNILSRPLIDPSTVP